MVQCDGYRRYLRVKFYVWFHNVTYNHNIYIGRYFFLLKDIDNSNVLLTFQLTSTSNSCRGKSFLWLSSKSTYPLKTFQSVFRNALQAALTTRDRML